MKKILLILTIALNINFAYAEIATFSTATGPVTIDVGDVTWWANNIASFNDSASHLTAAVEAAAAQHGGYAVTGSGMIICANSGDLNTSGSTITSTTGAVSTETYTAGTGGATCGSCTVTNACGQVFNGDDCGGSCNAGVGIEDINSSCIGDFTCGSGLIQPNGSIDCKWKLNNANNIKSVCGFFDLTTPTPRPIPGLQDIDIKTQSVRISNIQSTTRFCLICKFYSLVGNTALGNAAAHQWVRVVRIGEQ